MYVIVPEVYTGGRVKSNLCGFGVVDGRSFWLTSQLTNCYNDRKQTAAGDCATIIFRLKFQIGFANDRLSPTEHSKECHYAAAYVLVLERFLTAMSAYKIGDEVEIIFIIGLPGSGKSTLIKTEYADETTFLVFDDVKGDAVLDYGDFTYSSHYPNIVNEMKDGSKNIVISDISFCEHEKFKQAYQILNWWITEHHLDYKIKSVIFKNEPEKCIRNINRDNNRNNQARVKMVKRFSPNFDPDTVKLTGDDYILDVYGE